MQAEHTPGLTEPYINNKTERFTKGIHPRVRSEQQHEKVPSRHGSHGQQQQLFTSDGEQEAASNASPGRPLAPAAASPETGRFP